MGFRVEIREKAGLTSLSEAAILAKGALECLSVDDTTEQEKHTRTLLDITAV